MSTVCRQPCLHAGDLSVQDLLAANPDWADQQNGYGTPEQPGAGAPLNPGDPSPLLRWTSDGSMMEELLKSFGSSTPTHQGSGAVGTHSSRDGQASLGLFKDSSFNAAMLASLLSTGSEVDQAQVGSSGFCQFLDIAQGAQSYNCESCLAGGA